MPALVLQSLKPVVQGSAQKIYYTSDKLKKLGLGGQSLWFLKHSLTFCLRSTLYEPCFKREYRNRENHQPYELHPEILTL